MIEIPRRERRLLIQHCDVAADGSNMLDMHQLGVDRADLSIWQVL
jgi:hypothetical protein